MTENSFHNKCVITKGVVNDAQALTDLSITTFRDTFGAQNKKADMDKYIADEMNLGKLTAELNDSNNIFFLARCNELIAGYAKLRVNKEPVELINYNALEIERIYVLQKCLGKKIGAALMQHCLNYAKAGQHDVVWLGVWEHNDRAVAFYKRFGFELFGSHEFRLGDDIQTDVLMMKKL